MSTTADSSRNAAEEAERLLIFDFGNVIAFFDHHRACRQLAELTGGRVSAYQVYSEVFDSGLEERFDRGQITGTDFEAALLRILNMESNAGSNLKTAWSDIFWPNRRLLELLSRLAPDPSFELRLASNTNEWHWNCVCANPAFKSLATWFPNPILSFQIGHRKPDHKFFEACVAGWTKGLETCVYIDDREDFASVAEKQHAIPALVYDPAFDLARFLDNKEAMPKVRSGRVSAARHAGKDDLESARQIYQQKYLQYRHFDSLRWQVPSFVVGVAPFVGLFIDMVSPPLIKVLGLLLYSILAAWAWWYLGRLTYHIDRNTRALQNVALRLGDFSVPDPPDRPEPVALAAMLESAFWRRWFRVQSAAVWYRRFVALIGILAALSAVITFVRWL